MKCIFCNWENDNETYHKCSCGKEINLTKSKGICDACVKFWDYAQCPNCGEMGLIVDDLEMSEELIQLLESESLLSNDEERDMEFEKERLSDPPSYSHCQLLLCNKSIGEEDVLNVQFHIIRKAQKWLSSKEDYFEYCPTAREEYEDILEEDAEFEEVIESGMSQICNKAGFDTETPLRNLDVFGFNRLIRILRLVSNRRTTDYNTMTDGYVIDRFELSGNTGDIVMFNRVDYPDAKSEE